MLKWFFKLAAGVGLAAGVVAGIAWFYPEKFLCLDSGRVAADVIIVLGGGSHERPMRAAELFLQHAAPRILLTGEGDDQINRHLLIQAGVPAAAIEVESKSTTTHENAEFSVKRLRAETVHSAILVTSWYHARRAQRTFEHAAPEMNFYSRPSYFAYAREEWVRLGIDRRMRMEFVKLAGYWIRYGVRPF